MKIKIDVTTSESLPPEKIRNTIIRVVKTAIDVSDGLTTDVSVTECLKTLDGKVVGWVELNTEP